MTIRIVTTPETPQVLEVRNSAEVKVLPTTIHRLFVSIPPWETKECFNILKCVLRHLQHIENVHVHHSSRFGNNTLEELLKMDGTISKLTVSGTILDDCRQVNQLKRKSGIQHLVLSTEKITLRGLSLEGLKAFQVQCENCVELSQFSTLSRCDTIEFFHLKIGNSVEECPRLIMSVARFIAQRLPNLKKLKLTGNTRVLAPLVDASQTVQSLEINWDSPSDLIELVNLLHNILPRLKRLRLVNASTNLVSMLPSVLPRAPDGGLQV